MQQDNLHITCTEAENYLSLFVEDELDPSCSGLLEQHLETCESCRQLEEELSSERLWILENSIHSPSLGTAFSAKVCKKIREEAVPGTSLAERLRKASGWSGLAAAGILLALLASGFFSGGEMPNPDRELALEIMAGESLAATAAGRAPGPADSTLVSLLARNDQQAEPGSLAGTGKDDNAELVAFSPEVSPAIQPIKTLSAGFNQLDMGQLFGLFARRYEKVTTPALKPISLDDPCLDDLNDDGKVDGGDVAYGCLLLLESKPSAPCSDPDQEKEETPDCENRAPCV